MQTDFITIGLLGHTVEFSQKKMVLRIYDLKKELTQESLPVKNIVRYLTKEGFISETKGSFKLILEILRQTD